MNLYIIIIVLILLILYNIQGTIVTSLSSNTEYSIGIVNNDITLKFTKLLVKLSKLNIKLIYYSKSNELLSDLNNNVIQFGIDNENNYLDGYLGLNSYKNNKLDNLRHITGIYYNYYYFITNIISNNNLNNISNIHDLKDFYKNNKRHFIVGTEELYSVSFNGLMILLYMYGLKPINISSRDKNKVYDEYTIFYMNLDIDTLMNDFNNNKCDGIFLLNIYNYSYIRKLIDNKDVLFLDITFKDTPLDRLYNYFYTKNVTISNYNEDLDSTYTFVSKSVKFVLLSNNKVDNNVVYKLTETYYKNNTILINNLLENDSENSYNTEEHNIFEPIDMIFSDTNSKIHPGAHKYIESLGFIIKKKNPLFKPISNIFLDDSELQLDFYENNKKTIKHYWKYDKIGLNNFLI